MHQLAIMTLIVTVQQCCEKCCTFSQMPNKLICYKFTASAMTVSLLLLKNTVDGFLCAELRIVECFPRCSIRCVNVIPFPVPMFHRKGHVKNMWRNRKTLLKWYSVALLEQAKTLYMFRCFTKACMANIAWRRIVPFHPQRVQNLHPGAVPCILNFVNGNILIVNCFH